MFKLIVNSLRKRAKVVLILLPILLVSDQLWAKSSKLLILGDSLSAGYGLTQAQSWVSLLQDAWQKSNITVVNAAISGETTDGALARLPRLLSQHSPSHIYVELGGNDGLQGHSITKNAQQPNGNSEIKPRIRCNCYFAKNANSYELWA